MVTLAYPGDRPAVKRRSGRPTSPTPTHRPQSSDTTAAVPPARLDAPAEGRKDDRVLGNLFNRDQAAPALVRPAESVADLAAEANAQHDLGQAASQRGVEHYRAAGEALLKIKGQVGHGKYLKALGVYTKFSRQTAAKYVRLAREWAKCKGALHLTDALRLLTEPADDHGNCALSETYLGPRYQPGGGRKPDARERRRLWNRAVETWRIIRQAEGAFRNERHHERTEERRLGTLLGSVPAAVRDGVLEVFRQRAQRQAGAAEELAALVRLSEDWLPRGFDPETYRPPRR
jgi:hypothetical protein